MLKRESWLLASLALMAACSSKMDIQVIEYPGASKLASRDPGCAVAVYATDAGVPAGCVDVGDVFVGDTGWSIDCGSRRVVGEVEERACRVGADAVVVRELDDWNSSCHQVRARLLNCSAKEEAP